MTLLEVVLVTGILSALFAGSLRLLQGLDDSRTASIEQRRSLVQIERLSEAWLTAVTSANEIEVDEEGHLVTCFSKDAVVTSFAWIHGEEQSLVEWRRTGQPGAEKADAATHVERYILKEQDQVQWNREGQRIEMRIQDGRFDDVSYQVEAWIDAAS
ncbi:MAG: hypothetical protein AAGD07_18155 [Planctomycetota bacterium]